MGNFSKIFAICILFLLSFSVNASNEKEDIDTIMENLSKIAMQGNQAEFISYINKHSLIGKKDKDGDSPIMLAAALGLDEALSELVSKGADVNTTRNGKSSPLIFASFQGHTKCVQILLESGANPDYQEPKHKFTPLIIASGKNNFRMVKLLIKHGADPKIKAKDGVTAYLVAKSRNNEEIAKYLNSL